MIISNYLIYGRDYSGSASSKTLVANDSDHLYIYLLEDFASSPNNLLANDTIDGIQATTSNVNLTILSTLPPYVSIDSDGNIIIDQSTAPLEAQFDINYSICQIDNPSNCATANAHVGIYYGIPKAITANPSTGCSNSTTEVQLISEGFYGVTDVYIGATPVVSFEVIDYFTMNVVIPSGLPIGSFNTILITNAFYTVPSGINFTIIAPPIVNPITGSTVLCQGGTTDLNTTTPGGTWISSDDSIATVDGDGIVTGIGSGDVTISYCVTDLGCTTCQTHEMTVYGAINANNPLNEVVLEGEEAIFQVDIIGGDITGFQWEISTDGGSTFTPIVNDSIYSGATTNKLTISETTNSMNNYLYRIITYAPSPCFNFETSPAMLNVAEFGIISDPQNVTVCKPAEDSAEFNIITEGDVAAIQWYIDKGLGFEPIVDGVDGGLTFLGSLSNTLQVSGLELSNSGYQFAAIVDGGLGSQYPSNLATVTVATCP